MRYELSACEWNVIMPMLEQTARRPPRKRPACPQWYLLGLAVGRAVARSAGNLRAPYDLLQPLCPLAAGRRLGPIMEALAAAHDAAVRMIDTSIVRVHQHGACIAGKSEDMGRSRGGLSSKVHAVVDANGLPVRVGLSPGEAHDNRLCPVLLAGLRPRTMVLADRGYDADWIRELVNQQGARRC